MDKYIVSENGKSKNNNFGIYDYLNLQSNIKTLGIFLDDKYIFEVGIGDHHVQADIYNEKYGLYNLYISTHRDPGMSEITISFLEGKNRPKKLSLYQYRCIIKILKECKKYVVESGEKVKLRMSGEIFKDKEYRSTTNIDALLKDVALSYENRREELREEFDAVEDMIFNPKVELQIYDIDRFLNFFTKKTKQVKKR